MVSARCLTRESAYPVHLVVLWKSTFKQPWLLATNIQCPALALHLYGRRMWIEEMFGELKTNDFDLEVTHLCAADRINRLTLAVCLLFVWSRLGWLLHNSVWPPSLTALTVVI